MRFALPVAALFVLAACGDPDVSTIEISAAPKTVEASTSNYTTITVTGKTGETPLVDQSEIHLTTNCGHFRSPVSGEKTAEVYMTGQKATVRLYAESQPCKAEVDALFIDVYSNRATASTSVDFVLPPVTRLNFTCSATNIGAFLTGADIRVRCDATPENAKGEPVRNAVVNFLTEAGGFDKIDTGDEGDVARVLYAYNPRKDGREPEDVPPFDQIVNGQTIAVEPRWIDPDSNNQVRNPRDGLVTLVAYVESSAAAGIQGEPYVDANDNGRYDPGEDFFDANGNGQYDESQDTHIWKMIKVLWTGESYPTAFAGLQPDSQGQPVDRVVPRGQSRTFNFRFLDRNLNILASTSGTDQILWAANEGSVSIPNLGVASFGQVNAWGMDIGSDFNFTTRAPDSFLRGANYSLTFRNINEDVEEDELGVEHPIPQDYEICASIYRSAATDEDGNASLDWTDTAPHQCVSMPKGLL